jgi:hypothetical protein
MVNLPIKIDFSKHDFVYGVYEVTAKFLGHLYRKSECVHQQGPTTADEYDTLIIYDNGFAMLYNQPRGGSNRINLPHRGESAESTSSEPRHEVVINVLPNGTSLLGMMLDLDVINKHFSRAELLSVMDEKVDLMSILKEKTPY